MKCCKYPVVYYPVNQTLPGQEIELINPSFEDGPGLPPSNYFGYFNQSQVAGWQTTDPTGLIEIWASGFNGGSGPGINAHQGSFFVEMNSFNNARLSQSITVPSPKGRLYYSVTHRQRQTGDESGEIIIALDGIDTVVETMDQSSLDAWTTYTGFIDKPCGTTSTELAFNSLTNGSIGNFLDNARMWFLPFDVECRQGYWQCGKLHDEDGNVIPEDQYTLCDPSCNTGSNSTPQVVQIEMTDTAMDYASTVERTTPWGSSFVSGLNDGFLTAVNNEYSVSEESRLLISGGISLIEQSGNTSRNNISFWWQVFRNGAWQNIGIKHQDNYMRNATGHEETSQDFPSFAVILAAGERLRMRHDQISGAGGVQVRDPSAQSFIQFLKI